MREGLGSWAGWPGLLLTERHKLSVSEQPNPLSRGLGAQRPSSGSAQWVPSEAWAGPCASGDPLAIFVFLAF